MSKKPKKPKTYQELKEVWYKKLKDSGFIDAEINDYGDLAYPSSRFTKTLIGRLGFYAREEYYNMANKFLNTHKFNSPLEKIIWEYWSNGLSVRNIAVTLQKTKVVNNRFDRNRVWNILKPLIHEMKKIYLVGYK